MNSSAKVLLSSLCVAALLSGCGKTGPAAAPNTSGSAGSASSVTETDGSALSSSLEMLRAANSLNALMDRHTSVFFQDDAYQSETQDVATSSVAGQYSLEGGHLQMMYKYKDQDGTLYYSEGHADDTYAAAVYEGGPKADDQKYMTLFYDEDSYRAFLAARWDAEENGQETVLSDAVGEDGVRVVTVQTKDAEDSDYTVTEYCVDNETYEINASTVTVYDAQGEVLAVTQHAVIYDQPQKFEFSPFEAVTAGTNYCELTEICDPQGDDMRVNWYPVAHDTDVSFYDQDAYTLYGDEDLTQKLDPLSSIDVSGAAANVFVVPNN